MEASQLSTRVRSLRANHRSSTWGSLPTLVWVVEANPMEHPLQALTPQCQRQHFDCQDQQVAPRTSIQVEFGW
jgi:hypothetical protein